jgi:hypothetical protein
VYGGIVTNGRSAVPAEDTPQEEEVHREATAGECPFDELAKELADGTTSRGQACLEAIPEAAE